MEISHEPQRSSREMRDSHPWGCCRGEQMWHKGTALGTDGLGWDLLILELLFNLYDSEHMIA